jgi:hypothetical protein
MPIVDLQVAGMALIQTPLPKVQKLACLKALGESYPDLTPEEVARWFAFVSVQVEQDDDPSVAHFCLTQSEVERAHAMGKHWSDTLLTEQRQECPKCRKTKRGHCREHALYPYLGAIGGGRTYLFTPTSIGTFAAVQFSGDPERHDLTDFERM